MEWDRGPEMRLGTEAGRVVGRTWGGWRGGGLGKHKKSAYIYLLIVYSGVGGGGRRGVGANC